MDIGPNGKVNVVLFDFGGVIAEEGFKQGIAVIARDNGLAVDEVIKAAFDATYASGYLFGKAPESSFWEELKQRTGIRGDNAALQETIYSRFIIRNWMLDLVKALKARNITTGILSDQTDILDRLNAEHDFFRWFDHVFNSYHTGKGKRDITLFDDVAAALKAEPAKILFIDDDPGHVDRARQKGWQALLYVDRPSFQRDMEKIFPPA